MEKYAIILAAGRGKRMNSVIPKQFLSLYKKPLWYYSVKTFLDTLNPIHIIIPTLSENMTEIQRGIKKYFSTSYPKIHIIEGGEMRFHSVKNALTHIPTNAKSIVFIHDSARCLIQSQLLKNLYTTAQKYQSAIPIIGVTDSIRQLDNNKYKYIDRKKIFSVQTPQVFQSDILLESFKTDFENHFTDDASVVEYAGYQLHFVQGDISNIKITYPVDIEIAKWYLKNTQL